MPPKGKKAAKAKAKETKPDKEKRKRGGEEDEESSDSDKGPEVKIEHPPIPTQELNKMNANLRWMAKNGKPEALDEFLALTRPQKREWYWTRYKFDTKCSYVKRSETRTESRIESTGACDGWITKYEIARLNGIAPGIDNYDGLVDAGVVGLETRPHHNLGLADAGVSLYYYVFEKMRHTDQATGRESALEGKVDLTDASKILALKDLGCSDVLESNNAAVELQIPQWKQEWLDVVKSAEAEQRKCKLALNSAEELLHSMEMQVDNKIYNVMAGEVKEKVACFSLVNKTFSATLVAANQKSGAEGEVSILVAAMQADVEELGGHRSGFKTYVDRIKKFIAST